MLILMNPVIRYYLNLLQVQPKHVKEAFRLLNKSIIRVETPDVQFDDDEEEQQEGKTYRETMWSKICVQGNHTSSGRARTSDFQFKSPAC